MAWYRINFASWLNDMTKYYVPKQKSKQFPLKIQLNEWWCHNVSYNFMSDYILK